jgi:hypothetical protein
MPTENVSDVPKGTLVLKGPARETRQRQPGAPGWNLGVSDAVPYSERTRQLRRAQQQRARARPTVASERADDDGDEEK